MFAGGLARIHGLEVHRSSRDDSGAKEVSTVKEVGRGSDPSSRTVIDEAVGVLIGWRGCSEREAFDEIARAVRNTGVGIGSLARALVELATGAEESAPHRAEVLRLWGDVMPTRVSLN
jgi:hypothetical protein